MEAQAANPCKNCGNQLSGNYCLQCGQRTIRERWSIPVLTRQFLNQLTNIETGILFTGKALLTFPGKMIREYWQGKTVVYYNPFRLLIWTAINLLITFWLGIDVIVCKGLQTDKVGEKIRRINAMVYTNFSGY